MKSRDALQFTREYLRIGKVTDHLQGLVAKFEDNWHHLVTCHDRCSFAATLYSATPGVGLLVVTFDDDAISLKKLHIDRVVARESDDNSEPVIIDNNGDEYALPGLGLLPDYETGQWGDQISFADHPIIVMKLISWLNDVHGKAAQSVAEELSLHLEAEHNILTVMPVEPETKAPDVNQFDC